MEVGGSGGAAGIGPGGSCRLRWACRLRFPSLARVVLPGIPVPVQLAPGVEAVEVSADPAAAGLRVGPGGSCRLRAGVRRLAPGSGSLQRCRPIQLAPSSDTIAPPASLRRRVAARWEGKGRPCRDYRGGGGGVGRPSWNPRSWAGFRAWRWWRCRPPFLESSFLGRIQGVEAVEVGGGLRVGLRRILSAALGVSAGWLLALSRPAGPGSIRHYCGPASLRRQLRWLRPQRRGGKRTVQGES